MESIHFFQFQPFFLENVYKSNTIEMYDGMSCVYLFRILFLYMYILYTCILCRPQYLQAICTVQNSGALTLLNHQIKAPKEGENSPPVSPAAMTLGFRWLDPKTFFRRLGTPKQRTFPSPRLYFIYGGFLKWWVSPTNPWVFPTKNDQPLGCERGGLTFGPILCEA